MQNSRFWAGLLFFTGVPVSLLMGRPWQERVQYSHLEGMLTFQGHPASRGVILFESMDRKRSSDILVAVDERGRFAREVDWQGDLQGRTRFRIHVEPDPRPSRKVQKVAQPVMIGLSQALIPGEPSASANEQSIPYWNRRFPEVWLGPEPSRLTIDLKD
jgi:hypothetical protein